MAKVETRSPGPSLVARMEERFAAPFKRNGFASRTWFVLALTLVLAVHAAVLAYLFYRDVHDPVHEAKVEETPVEVIIEKPPAPPPEKKAEQKKPEAKQEIEKPASSAPRAPNEDKIDTQANDKDTHATKAPTPPKDGRPEPSREASSPTEEPAKPDTVEDAAQHKEVLEKDAEALDKAVPEPPKKPASLVAKARPPAKIHKDQTALDQLAGDSTLPDYSFRRPTKTSPVYGGTEDSRYLAIVYGMIMANRHAVEGAGPETGGNVTVSFNVDDGGNVVGTDVVRASGYPAIDHEAMAAIRRASPFPPPPPGAPHGLIATIDFTSNETLTMGHRDRP